MAQLTIIIYMSLSPAGRPAALSQGLPYPAPMTTAFLLLNERVLAHTILVWSTACRLHLLQLIVRRCASGLLLG
jgi:hypothetical protein